MCRLVTIRARTRLGIFIASRTFQRFASITRTLPILAPRQLALHRARVHERPGLNMNQISRTHVSTSQRRSTMLPLPPQLIILVFALLLGSACSTTSSSAESTANSEEAVRFGQVATPFASGATTPGEGKSVLDSSCSATPIAPMGPYCATLRNSGWLPGH